MVKALKYENPILKSLDALMVPNIPNSTRPAPLAPVAPRQASTLRPIAPAPTIRQAPRPAPTIAINQVPQSNGVLNPFPIMPVPAPVVPQVEVEEPKSNLLQDLVMGLLGSAQRVGGTAAQGVAALSTIPDIIPAAFGDERALRSAQMKKDFIDTVRGGEAIDGGSMSFIDEASQKGTATPIEFAKDFVDAGVETANLIPITRGATVVAQGGKEGAKMLTKEAAKQALINNSKEALVYGGSSTINDALQERLTPEGVATNFLAPLVMGTGSELLGRGAKDLVTGAIKAQNGPNSQAGFIRFPGSDKLDPADYKAEVINRIRAEYNHLLENELAIKQSTKANSGDGKQFAETKALFKEFNKNPEAFVDKYELLPKDKIVAVKSPVKPAPATPPKPVPTKSTTPNPLAPIVKTPKPTTETTAKSYEVFRGSGDNKQVKTLNDLSILGNDNKYYAFDEGTAKKFGDTVEKSTISLDKPLEITNDAQWRDISQKAGNKYPSPTGLSKEDTQKWIDNINKYAKSQGHDGVVVKMDKTGDNAKTLKSVFGSDQVVPFSTTEVPKAKTPSVPAKVAEIGSPKPVPTSKKNLQVVDKSLAPGPKAKVDVPKEIQGKTLYRGIDDREWQALQNGEVSRNGNRPGEAFIATDKDLADMAVENHTRHGKDAYMVEYKPGTENKVTRGGSLGHIQNPNNIIEGEYLGKNLGIDDIAKVTDSSGKVIYEAPLSTPIKTTTKNPLAPKGKAPIQEVPTLENVGTAKTGEKGKSSAKVSKGRVYEKTSIAASKGRGAIEAEKTNYDKFIKTVDKKSVPTTKQADTARALQEKFTPGTAEHKELGKIAGRNVTEAAQTLGIIDKNVRKKASAKEITTRFANKLYTILDDDRTVNKATFKPVEEANRAFEIARKAKDKAYNKFQADPSDANLRAYERANQEFTKADVKSLFEEYNTVAKAIKDGGTKNADAKEYLETLKKNSGIYFMDYVDSNLLSSTRVMINNYINTLGVGAEEALFGKAGAALARKLVPDAKVGGGSARGQIMGAKIGAKEMVTEAKLRQSAHQNGFTKTISNFTTTGNTLGDHNITGVAYSSAYDAYRQGLKAKGYKGAELERRAKVATLADIEGKVPEAKQQALADVGLASTFDVKSRKIESMLAEKLAGKMGDSKLARVAAKTLVRVSIGFPTVTIRGAIGGAKRTTLGVPTAIHATVNAITKGDPNVRARLIKNSVKEFGSGATMIGTGYALASTGLISGAYPEDQNERDAWKREGKTDYSININGDWWNLPQALGVFALPFMVGANAQQNVKNGDPVHKDILETTWDTILNLSPADQLKATLELLEKGGDDKLARIGSSIAKAVTPLGSLLNQIAKAFDPNANDTSQGDAINQFLAKVQDGIPGAANLLTDKEVEGRKIANPSPIARMLGAVSHEQKDGVQATQDIKAAVVEANKQLTDNGVFSDDIRNLMPDDETKALFDEVKSGENTDPADSKKIHEAITKNVTATEDTRFLEDGNYDANLAVLKTKRDLLAADPTTRQKALDDYDEQIARGQVYKDNKTPYELTQEYSETTPAEWRKMGDPEDENYNPEKYQALWDLDSKLAVAGGSKNTDDPKANKFSVKESKSGKGRGGGGGSGGGKANAKASGLAILDAAKDAPVPKLPDAPTVKQAVYRRVPVSNGSPASTKSKFAPITISARSRQSKKA